MAETPHTIRVNSEPGAPDSDLEFSFDRLAQSTDVAVETLSHTMTELQLAKLAPLAQVDSSVLLAVMRVGKMVEHQIWADVNSDGVIDKEAVYLTDRNYKIRGQKDNSGAKVLVAAGAPFHIVGRNHREENPGLPVELSDVSRNHYGVLLSDGVLKIADMSTFGTELVHGAANIEDAQTNAQRIASRLEGKLTD